MIKCNFTLDNRKKINKKFEPENHIYTFELESNELIKMHINFLFQLAKLLLLGRRKSWSISVIINKIWLRWLKKPMLSDLDINNFGKLMFVYHRGNIDKVRVYGISILPLSPSIQTLMAYILRHRFITCTWPMMHIGLYCSVLLGKKWSICHHHSHHLNQKKEDRFCFLNLFLKVNYFDFSSTLL